MTHLLSLKLVTSNVQLQTVKLNLYDDETCYNHAANFDYLPPYTPEHTSFNSEVEFCAGHYNMTTNTYTSEADSCYGDSGGPLGTDRNFHE